MTWKPETYLSFETFRTRPAVDLLRRVQTAAPARVADLGCGPGNSTRLLTDRWPDAHVVGVDSSPEMLAKARRDGPDAEWVEADISTWQPDEPLDVVFTNAALQWVGDHETLFPRLLEILRPGGTLAIQVPRNIDSPSERALDETVKDGPWAEKFASGARHRRLLTPDEYYDLYAGRTKSLDLWETIYLQPLEGENPVLHWMSGTALLPFTSALEGDELDAFLKAFGDRLLATFPKRADGRTIFPFRRLFILATV